MISHKHKFIIITPPKTGSTSVTAALINKIQFYEIQDQSQGQRSNFDYKESPNDEKFDAKHRDAGFYNEYITKERYLTCGLIRNPYDRMVSWWKWKRPQIDFIYFLNTSAKNYFRNRNLIDFFSIEKKLVVDHFIRFESLNSDFLDFCQKAELGNITLPKLNSSNNTTGYDEKGYRQFYTSRERKIIETIYKADLDYFGYTF